MELHERVAKQLAVTLKALMKDRELTVSSLHKRTGIGRETLYRILRQESLPTTEVLLRLAAELGVSPGLLLDNQSGRLGSPPKKSHDEQAIYATLQAIEGRLERIESLIHAQR